MPDIDVYYLDKQSVTLQKWVNFQCDKLLQTKNTIALRASIISDLRHTPATDPKTIIMQQPVT